MADLFMQNGGQIGQSADIDVVGIQSVRRYSDDSLIIVFHREFADRAAANDGKWDNWYLEDNQDIAGIPLAAQSVRDESVVGGIGRGRMQEPVDEERT
jgi:hypothetical protein